jgi:hypothetical protein
VSYSKRPLNLRAAAWAAVIVAGALVVEWTPHIIWPSSGRHKVLAFVLSTPGMVLLVPGITITGFVGLFAYQLYHHAEIAQEMAAHPGETDGTYFVFNRVGLDLSIPFLCSIVVNWIFYFLIVRQVLKARSQPQDRES